VTGDDGSFHRITHKRFTVTLQFDAVHYM
jgi:hypothetical protein